MLSSSLEMATGLETPLRDMPSIQTQYRQFLQVDQDHMGHGWRLDELTKDQCGKGKAKPTPWGRWPSSSSPSSKEPCMPPPLCWSYGKDVSVKGRRLELWVLTTVPPSFKSGSWLYLGGDFWVSWLAGWGIRKNSFLFSFLFIFLLVGFVLFCLVFCSSWSQFLLSMTAITDPWARLVLGAWRIVPRGTRCLFYLLRGTHTTDWLKGYAKFFFWEFPL